MNKDVVIQYTEMVKPLALVVAVMSCQIRLNKVK